MIEDTTSKWTWAMNENWLHFRQQAKAKSLPSIKVTQTSSSALEV